MKKLKESSRIKKTNEKIIVIIMTIVLLSMILINNPFTVKAIEEINNQNKTEENKLIINQEVEKYLNLEKGQTLLQEKISVEIENFETKEYEIIRENAPTIQNQYPETIIVILNGEKIDKTLYTYNPEIGKVEITLKKENNIENWGNEKEEYKIIYKYNDIDIEKEENITLDTEITMKLENINNELKDNKTKDIELVKIGENVSISGKITNEIYKGYMYENGENETEFNEIYNIEVSDAQNENKILINSNDTYFEKGNTNKINANENIYFKSTKILKENMLKILGNEGTITIKNEDGEILSEINKNTKQNEYGIIEIFYNEKDVKKLEITTTTPIEEGSLKILNNKAILPNTGYSKEELKEITKLKQSISANESNYVIETELLDTTIQADFNINKTELSTMLENQELEIKTILKSYNNTMDLYENSIIKITLPEEIEEISLKEDAKILYNEEIKIQDVNINKNQIIIQLEGNQIKYNEKSTEGIVIDLALNVKLNKEATNVKKNINMIIQNNNKKIELNKEINIISPKEVIALNNIEEFGIETYGIEEKSNVDLKRKEEEKEVKINSQIINNSEKEISNVKIIGEFPTNGERLVKKNKIENNLNIVLNSEIETNKENCNIYYTENSKATEDLENAENGWKANIEELSEVKKYMITIERMTKGEKIEFNYKTIIPENLEYNQKAIEGYKVIYEDKEIQSEKVIESTYIEMTTGKGPIVESDLKGFIGEKEIIETSEIKAGEGIKYKINLKNIGTEDSGEIKLSLNIPEGMYYKDDKTKRKVEINIKNIRQNEKIEETINLVVNEDLAEAKKIEDKINIKYKDTEKESNSIKYNIVPSEVIGNVEMITNNETTFIEGDIIEYRATIKNNSDNKIENIQFKWIIPDFCKINSQAILGENNLPEINFEPDDIIKIEKLEPKQSLNISLHISIEEIKDNVGKISVSAIMTHEDEKYQLGDSEEKLAYGINNFDIKMEANKENGFVEPGDEIIYKIKVKNKNLIKTVPIIKNNISTNLKILEIKIDEELASEEEIDIKSNNEIYITTEFEAEQTKIITIKTIVNKKESVEKDEKITSQAILTTEKLKKIESNIIEHIINRENEDSDNNNGNPEDKPNEKKNKINGITWKDANSNGALEDDEERLEGIEVFLINMKDNQVQKDKEGKEIKAITNTDGSYVLSEIPNGEYLIAFKYNNTKYKITTYKANGVNNDKNSKAISKKMQIDGKEDIYGVTDIIKVEKENISNINMGLIETEKFDFKLNKYISKVTVENEKGKKIYNYNDTQLAKVELDSKELYNSKLTIEYKIEVKNEGEVKGYIKNIVDYIPEGFIVNQNINKNWYKKDGKIYNESLSNKEINPGESQTITLTVQKNINKGEVKTYSNNAEIFETYNELGIKDINSIEGNENPEENDFSTASIIISIKTGKIIMYTTLTILCMLIIVIGIIIIKKKVIE